MSGKNNTDLKPDDKGQSEQPAGKFLDNGVQCVRLRKPIKANGEYVTVLRLPKPKGRDFRAIKDIAPFGMALDLAAKLAGVPPSSIDQLEDEDLGDVLEITGCFLEKFLGTGTK